MDIQDTILRRDHSTAPSSLDPDVQSAADVAAIAPADEAHSNRSTGESSNVPKIMDDASPRVEPGDGRTYGQMTKPNPEAPVGRATQLVNYLTSTSRKVSSGVAGSIRRDPYSAAVVGVGLAWLILQWWTRRNVPTDSSTRKSSRAQSLGRPVLDDILTRLRPANATTGSHINGMAQHLADVAETQVQHFNQQAQQLGSQARGLAAELSGQIQEAAYDLGGEAQDQVNDMRNNARGTASRLSCDVQGTSQRLTESIDKALRQNLVSVSAIGPSLVSAVGPVAAEAARVGQRLDRAVTTKRL